MRFEQITIVGVGLIGGSVGLAAKARGAVARVVGVDSNASNLKVALERGALDAGTPDLAEGVRGSALVVICTPVDRVAPVIRAALPHLARGALLTDAGSTKARILADLGPDAEQLPYVPAHPLAGSEKSGPEHARGDLFEGRPTVLVVGTFGANWERAVAVGRFWEALGSRAVLMSAEEHDRVLAVTSHLPHAVASAVAGVTHEDWLRVSAGGFRDVTRVAAGDPELWASIFLSNCAPVLAAVDSFGERLAAFRALLAAGDRAGLVEWLREGKQVRDALGT